MKSWKGCDGLNKREMQNSFKSSVSGRINFYHVILLKKSMMKQFPGQPLSRELLKNEFLKNLWIFLKRKRRGFASPEKQKFVNFNAGQTKKSFVCKKAFEKLFHWWLLNSPSEARKRVLFFKVKRKQLSLWGKIQV